MKGKLIIAAMLATVVGYNAANASIARQAVFGGAPTFTTSDGAVTVNTVNGGLWYDDNYNVFYNPALVNDYKNYVTINKGLEGGWFSSFAENFAYGIYMNRGNGTATPYGSTAGLVGPGVNAQTRYLGGSTLLDTQRPVDFFLAGDTGVKWGLHVAWAYNRNQTGATAPSRSDYEISNRYWHFDLGAEVMGLEPFVGATLFSKSQEDVPGRKVVQNLEEMNAGVRYKYENWTPYVIFRNYDEHGQGIANANQVRTRFNVYGGGIGHDSKVADGVHIYKHIGFFWADAQDEGAVGTPTEPNRNFTEKLLPLNLVLEADATSWLALRAGAHYDFLRERVSDRTTGSDTTNVSDRSNSQAGRATFVLGSTFKFGKLHLDSAFGNGPAVAAAGNPAIAGSSEVGFDSQTFALLSASYNW